MNEIVFTTLTEARQAAFTGVVRGLRHQKWKRSVSDDDVYMVNKGKPGVHCALGWLTPWDNQRPSQIFNDLSMLHPALVPWALGQSVFRRFLQDLLQMHDQGFKPCVMEALFREFGKGEGL